MTINDGLGGGVIRLRYDMIYEQIHLKKTPENSLPSNDDFVWEHPITSLAYVLYEKEEKEKLWKSWVNYTVLKEEKEEKEK